MFGNHSIAVLIAFDRFIVTAAIEFNDQFLRRTREVGDVWRNRMLTAELVVFELTFTQDFPQQRLEHGFVAAQFAGAVCGFAMWFHVAHLLPAILKSYNRSG